MNRRTQNTAIRIPTAAGILILIQTDTAQVEKYLSERHLVSNSRAGIEPQSLHAGTRTTPTEPPWLSKSSLPSCHLEGKVLQQTAYIHYAMLRLFEPGHKIQISFTQTRDRLVFVSSSKTNRFLEWYEDNYYSPQEDNHQSSQCLWGCLIANNKISNVNLPNYTASRQYSYIVTIRVYISHSYYKSLRVVYTYHMLLLK